MKRKRIKITKYKYVTVISSIDDVKVGDYIKEINSDFYAKVLSKNKTSMVLECFSDEEPDTWFDIIVEDDIKVNDYYAFKKVSKDEIMVEKL